VVSVPSNVTYDGNAHAASGTATGVESLSPADLTSELHLSYSTDGGTTFSTDAPVDAGTYEVYYTFDGDANYQAVSTPTDSGQAVVINQAVRQLTWKGGDDDWAARNWTPSSPLAPDATTHAVINTPSIVSVTTPQERVFGGTEREWHRGRWPRARR